MIHLFLHNMSEVKTFLESCLKDANDPKRKEESEKRLMELNKRQQKEKEQRIQRRLDKLIQEEELKGGRTLRELFNSRYEEQIERLRHKAISSLQIEEETRIKLKLDEECTLTLKEIYGEQYEEEMERLRDSTAFIVRLEIAAEEREEELRTKIEKRKQQMEAEEKRKQQMEAEEKMEQKEKEEKRKCAENHTIPLTMKDLYLICPGFDKETLQRACNDLNLEMAKRIARKAFPNKFK